MNYKPILIVAGEPNSIFFEIFFKSIKQNKFMSPIILVCSKDLLKKEMKYFNIKKKIKKLDIKRLDKYHLDNKYFNVINVDYKSPKLHSKISQKSNSYIKKCFSIVFELLKNGYTDKLINGPVSKKYFLKNKFPGITEFIANYFSKKKFGMLIYNKSLSVCPLTTHHPLKSVSKKITENEIRDKIELIYNFYKKIFNLSPKIAVTGLNPHCESYDKFNEDDKIIKPIIKKMKKKFDVSGPFPADTIFLKNNRKKFNVILGMYHDQVLTPMKTIFEYNAINITLGLPFIRISPDHGPNIKMAGKNISSPKSLIKCLQFLDKSV